MFKILLKKKVCILIRPLCFFSEEKMQQPINDEIHLGQTVDLSDNTQKVKSINYSSNFNSLTEKMTKLQRFLKQGVIGEDMLRYLPGMKTIAYQSMIFATKTIKKPADSTYKDLQVL